MTKVQIVFHSMCGYLHRLAEAIAGGAREVDGAEAALYRVPEVVPDDVLDKSGANVAQQAFAHLPVAVPQQLADADAIAFGTPTRFDKMTVQMRNFLDHACGRGERMLSESELAIGRFQGRHVAEIARALRRGRA